MTNLPWAHRIFPEYVIMRRRRLYRPDEAARSYAEIRSGFNRMTLHRFEKIVRRSGWDRFIHEQCFGRVNRPCASDASQIPGCREFFTVNLYSVLAAGNSN